jgi:hypothetical protein
MAAAFPGQSVGQYPDPGKRTGRYQGKVAVKASGYFAIATPTGTVTDIAARYCRKLHRSDGYSYQKGDRAFLPIF